MFKEIRMVYMVLPSSIFATTLFSHLGWKRETDSFKVMKWASWSCRELKLGLSDFSLTPNHTLTFHNEVVTLLKLRLMGYHIVLLWICEGRARQAGWFPSATAWGTQIAERSFGTIGLGNLDLRKKESRWKGLEEEGGRGVESKGTKMVEGWRTKMGNYCWDLGEGILSRNSWKRRKPQVAVRWKEKENENSHRSVHSWRWRGKGGHILI